MSIPLPRDRRHGLRKLNNAGLTAVAVVCLALGICASVTVFSVVDALLLRPLPGVVEQGRIVSLGPKPIDIPGFPPGFTMGVSFPTFLLYRDGNRVFSGLAAYHPVPLNLVAGSEPIRVRGQVVTDNYFSTLGLRPAAGRLLVPGEGARLSAALPAVISHGLWMRVFGGRGVVGKNLTLNGSSFTLVGVAPPGFSGTLYGDPADVWLPLETAPQVLFTVTSKALYQPKPGWLLWFFGRLAPGVTPEQAQTEMDLLATRLGQGVPSTEEPPALQVYPGLGVWPGNHDTLARPLVLASVLVGLLMLVVCSNLVGLLLVKAAARQEEIGVRLALGVTRGRLVRQLLVESLTLALLGGAAGFILALFAIDAIHGLPLGQFLPKIDNLRIDGRAVAFTLALSVGTGVLFGLVPALWSTRRELIPLLRPGAGNGVLDRGRTRLQEIFVVGQITISLVLLISTGLFVRTLINLQSLDPGFDPRRVVDLRIDLLSPEYSEARGEAFYDQLLKEVQKLPGVDSAALTLTVPLSQTNGARRLSNLWPAGGSSQKSLPVEYFVVSPGLFHTLGIPLLRGRDFSAADRHGAPGVVILDEAVALSFWPGKDPLGERVLMPGWKEAREVVGVVRSIRVQNHQVPRPLFYLPLAQHYLPGMALQVKAAGGEPQRLARVVGGVVHRLDPNLAVLANRLADEVEATLTQPRLFSWLLGGFSLVALLVTGIGLYGTLAFTVSRRTRELGIRMALGARSSEIMTLVIRRGLALTLTGLVLGLVGAAWTTSVFASLLFEVTPTDPAVFIVVALLLTLVGLAASSLPAYSATRVDPMNVIRHE
ncbi:MAG TPA: ABC transporter permease [Thermoanaerobaculia bacterium]|nr:ABC transporter permease [Thermoanaerobaculia bacterium]